MTNRTFDFVESVRDPITKLNLLIGFGKLPRATEHFWGMIRGGFVSLWAKRIELFDRLLRNPDSGGLEDVVLLIEPREAANSLPQYQPNAMRKAITGPLPFRNFDREEQFSIRMEQLPWTAFPLLDIFRRLGWQDQEKQEFVRYLWEQVAELGFVYPDRLSVAGIRIVLNQFRCLDDKLSKKVEAAILCSSLFGVDVHDVQDYFPLRGRSHEAAKQVHREGINIIVDELEACGMERFRIRSIFLRRIGWMGGDPSLASARCFDEHDCERHSALAAALSRLWGMYHSRPEPIHSVLRHLKSLESCGLYRLSTPTLPGDEPFFREKVIGLLAHGRIIHAYTALDILGNVVGARTTASWTDENKRSAILETLEQLFHEAFYLAFHVNQNILAAADLVTEFSWSTQVEKLSREELMVVHQAAAVLGHKFQPRLDIFASLFADPIPQTSE